MATSYSIQKFTEITAALSLLQLKYLSMLEEADSRLVLADFQTQHGGLALAEFRKFIKELQLELVKYTRLPKAAAGLRGSSWDTSEEDTDLSYSAYLRPTVDGAGVSSTSSTSTE